MRCAVAKGLLASENPGASEVRIQTKLRAGRIAQHAVDAGAVLLKLLQLRWRLEVLTLGQAALFLGDDVGLDALQLLHKGLYAHHQVALYGQVRQRFHQLDDPLQYWLEAPRAVRTIGRFSTREWEPF